MHFAAKSANKWTDFMSSYIFNLSWLRSFFLLFLIVIGKTTNDNF